MSGIIQATNLQVDNIKHSGGTTGLTINSDGDVTESNLCLSYWHKTTNSETISSKTLLDDWTEISDAHGFKRIGGAFTVSSGVFTFPKTGVYKINLNCAFNKPDPSTYVGCFINFSSNSGSSFDSFYAYQDLNDSSSTTVYASVKNIRYVNITNTSTHKVEFRFESATAVDIRGSFADTHAFFQRIAPPQS